MKERERERIKKGMERRKIIGLNSFPLLFPSLLSHWPARVFPSPAVLGWDPVQPDQSDHSIQKPRRKETLQVTNEGEKEGKVEERLETKEYKRERR